MPRPKRKPRAATMPLHIDALFSVGCGANSVSNDEFRRLWDQYGKLYCRMNPDYQESWAWKFEGMAH